MRQPVVEMGRVMADLLLTRMAGGDVPAETVLPTRLVARASSLTHRCWSGCASTPAPAGARAAARTGTPSLVGVGRDEDAGTAEGPPEIGVEDLCGPLTPEHRVHGGAVPVGHRNSPNPE